MRSIPSAAVKSSTDRATAKLSFPARRSGRLRPDPGRSNAITSPFAERGPITSIPAPRARAHWVD